MGPPLPRCLVHDKHSEPIRKGKFRNSSDMGLPVYIVRDKHSKPSRKGEF